MRVKKGKNGGIAFIISFLFFGFFGDNNFLCVIVLCLYLCFCKGFSPRKQEAGSETTSPSPSDMKVGETYHFSILSSPSRLRISLGI